MGGGPHDVESIGTGEDHRECSPPYREEHATAKEVPRRPVAKKSSPGWISSKASLS